MLSLLFSGLLWLSGRAGLEAVSGRWESVGPDSGATVQLLAVSPSATATVYAAVVEYSSYGALGSSIFRTADRGQSWRRVATRLPQISSLALDPGSPAIAYIGTEAGIFKTTNGGARWVASSNGLDSLDVNSLAIDPLSPSILYAGANAPTIPGSDGSAGGVFKSIDGGLTWRKSSTGITENAFGFLGAKLVTVAPSSPATIYTVNTEGIYKSVDAGSSWSLVNPLSGDYIFSLAIDPNAPSTVYLGAQYAVLKTTDGGATWKRIEQSSGLPDGLIRSLTVDPVSPSTIYAGYTRTQAGLAKTTDGGTTWVPLANGLLGALGDSVAFAIDPGNPSILYANGSKSTDGGATWTSANNGLRKMWVSSIVVSPGSSSFVYAAGTGGVFKSSDRGATWTQGGTGLPDSTILSLVEDPLSEGTLFAGGDGLYKTTDGAITWVQLPSTPSYRTPLVTSIAVDPQNSTTVYAATSRVYIGLGNYTGGGVLKTTDGGGTWTTLGNGLVEKSIGPIGIDPHDPSTLYIASGPTLFKSTDGGASTVPLSFGIDVGSVFVTAVAIDDREGIVYAGTFGAGIFKSTDGGSSWIRINQGLTDLSVLAIAIDRSAPATLYAGTKAGVFRSEDSGLTWHFFSAGLANSGVRSLAIAPGGPKTIYAGTGDDSVFRLDLSSSSRPMHAPPRVLTPRG